MQTIFKTIIGSQAYGTNIETSDIDYKGVYIQPLKEIAGFSYKQQIDVGKDECYYEVRRFLELLTSANPTVLEMLFVADEFIIEKSPLFDIIIENRAIFLTKKCRLSFGGYAVAQIKKAKGLNKKMNWERGKVARKTPIDFIYAIEEGKTIPIEKFLQANNLSQESCGLAKLNHAKDCYALYYDYKAKYTDVIRGDATPYGFRGLAVDDSNDVRLSSIPIGLQPETTVYFNKDGYSKHCKDYRDYQEWLENRNTQRYVDTNNHEQQIDGKNLLHCRRLLDMALEIATDKTITVRRPNRDYLLSIRKGEVDLEDIIYQAEKDLALLDELFIKSDLPEDVDMKSVEQILLKVRGLV